MGFGKPLKDIKRHQSVETLTEAERAKRERAVADAKPADFREPTGDNVPASEPEKVEAPAKDKKEAKKAKAPAKKKTGGFVKKVKAFATKKK